ncbi:MAG: hypothetical protein KAH20_05740 [Methylococcales bacterium]|nr:hypothetical protein [Methylococcales bacterium]
MKNYLKALPLIALISTPNVQSSDAIAPNALSPTGKISTNQPTFTWTAVPGTRAYMLYTVDAAGDIPIWQFVGAKQAGCSSGTGTCSYYDSSAIFSEGTGGFWYVNTFQQRWSSPNSNTLKFTVTKNGVTPEPEPVSDDPVIKAVGGGWETAGVHNIEAITLSSARSLLENIPGISLDPILLTNKGEFGPPPIVYFNRGPNNEYNVDVSVGGARWAQLVYQFSHEFMHIVSNYGNTPGDANQWFEEALCETAAMHSVNRLSEVWKTNPPFESLQGYSQLMENYFNDFILNEVEKAKTEFFKPGDTIATWYQREKQSLRDDAGQRNKNRIIANEIFLFFSESPDRWRSVKYLNLGNSGGDISLEAFLEEWKNNSPDDLKYVAETISGWFGF